ncbi:hypothetical protein [Streptomyces sp. NBC_00096]|uniref:hypothetical protein n=1 Tax=Streptomyces sp. NBC_00096 TaxID=2975650 RepID=UPI00324C9FC8
MDVAYGQAYEPSAAGGADLLVGAAGINSAVRADRLGTGSAPRELPEVAWIGIAGFETGVYGGTWGRGRFFGMTPVEPGRTNWYAAVPGATTARDLRDAFAGWHDPIPRVLADTAPRTWTATGCATSIRRCPPSSVRADTAPSRWSATRRTP